METESDDGDESLEPNEDVNFYQVGDDDAWTQMQGLETVDVDLLE